jgi:hypothetical protein
LDLKEIRDLKENSDPKEIRDLKEKLDLKDLKEKKVKKVNPVIVDLEVK